MLGLRLCCCRLEMLNYFWTGGRAFSFCSGPVSDIASPASYTGEAEGQSGGRLRILVCLFPLVFQV